MKIKVTAKLLSVRVKPNKDSKAVGTVTEGEVFEVLDSRKDFHKIGDDKWVMAKFTEELEERKPKKRKEVIEDEEPVTDGE